MSPPKGGFQGGTEDPVVDGITYLGSKMGGKCHQKKHQKNIPKIEQKRLPKGYKLEPKRYKHRQKQVHQEHLRKSVETTPQSLKKATQRHHFGDLFGVL